MNLYARRALAVRLHARRGVQIHAHEAQACWCTCRRLLLVLIGFLQPEIPIGHREEEPRGGGGRGGGGGGALCQVDGAPAAAALIEQQQGCLAVVEPEWAVPIVVREVYDLSGDDGDGLIGPALGRWGR